MEEKKLHWKFGRGGGTETQLIIGDNVTITSLCQISCCNFVSIGNNVFIGRNSFITDNSHGRVNRDELKIPPKNREIYSKGSVIIGDNVWIGHNVVIMSNVKIEDNSIIGANSVVTKDVPSGVVAAGVPCRVLKTIG